MAQDFAAKKLSLRLSWLLHGKKLELRRSCLGKQRKGFVGLHGRKNCTLQKACGRLGFIGLPGTQNSLLCTEPYPNFFAAENGKQHIFAAIAALTNKMVSSHGTDPDFSGRLADEHAACALCGYRAGKTITTTHLAYQAPLQQNPVQYARQRVCGKNRDRFRLKKPFCLPCKSTNLNPKTDEALMLQQLQQQCLVFRAWFQQRKKCRQEPSYCFAKS